jgi:hypothetical protein
MASTALYGAGPPIVHFAHAAVGRGVASAAARIALPLAGFGLAHLLGSGSGWPTQDMNGRDAVGGLAGGAAASGLDAALLGWDRWRGMERVGAFRGLALGASF